MKYLQLSVVACLLVILSGTQTALAASFPVEVDFSGATPADWELRGDAVWNTAVSGDQTLRLTDAVENTSGLAFFNDSFPSNLGIVSEFRYFSGGGTGADGFAFFLVDGDLVDENNIAAGAVGGALGYAQNGVIDNGIPHAYLGVGFDEFGNFSPAPLPDAVVLRGSGNGITGYDFLTNRDVFTDFGQRIDGGWRLARVTVQPGIGNATIRVEMSWDEGVNWLTVIDDYVYNQAPPTNLKLGFTGGTGGSTNIHAIGNLEVIIPVDLETTVTVPPSGTFERGDAITYTYTVTNNSDNDSATTTITNSVPVGALGIDALTWNLTSTHGSSSSGTGADIGTTTVSIPGGETVTVVVSGAVGADILDTTDLDHVIAALPEESVKDPSPSDAEANVNITTDAPTAAEAALLKIIAYADSNGTTTAPTVSDYATAGVTDVTGATLVGLNELLAASSASTLGDVQALADVSKIPSVTTLAASDISRTTATLNGDLVRPGDEVITMSGFEYGLTTAYGNTVSENSAGTGGYSVVVEGLSCDTQYHYRAYISTAASDTWTGSDAIFTTSRCSSGGSSATRSTARTATQAVQPQEATVRNIDDLKKQLVELQAKLASLKSNDVTPASVVDLPVRDLTGGMSGDDVTALQELLIAQGYAIPAGATGYFASQTRAALAAYQLANNVNPPQGYFGVITRTQMKAVGLVGLWW